MGFQIGAAFFGIFFHLIGFAHSEKAPYTFTKDATSAPQQEYFDYIIIGGGTAGCSLAATLSTSAKVAILERGGQPYGNPFITNKEGFLLVLGNTSPNSPAQLFISTDRVFSHRPRILGGGSSINAGFYSRASAEYVQQVGWDPQLVNDSYEWVERKIVFQPQVGGWAGAVRNGLLEAGVQPDRGFTYDHLIGTKVGGTIFDENGHRHSAADLLEYAEPSNITVYLHATVQQILFNNTSPGQTPYSYGVMFEDSNYGMHKAFLNKGSANEIILSAGTLGSPQLLMLSGIGPSHQFGDHGIEPILVQPMVGQNIVDNPMNPIIIPSRKPVETSLVKVVGITKDDNYIESSSGYFDLALFRKIVQQYATILMANLTVPTFSIPPADRPILRSIASLLPNTNLQAGAIQEKFKRPFSTGHLELQNSKARDNPKVTFNYFKDPRDVQSCVRGLKVIKRVVESTSVADFLYPFTSFKTLIAFTLTIPINLRPRHLSSLYGDLEQYCKDTVMSYWHYHGGCQIDSVVDRDYKVIGVDGLRVIDSSTFNESPGTNPQATVMMLGRYMGQKILLERFNG